MSVLKELQALDAMLNPKEGRPLIGGITIHSGSEFITRILAELEKNQRPVCEWKEHPEDGYWQSACGEQWCFVDGGVEDNSVRFCHGCGGKVEVMG